MGFFPASANQSVAGSLTVTGGITVLQPNGITTNSGAASTMTMTSGLTGAGVAGISVPGNVDVALAGDGLRVAEGSNAKQGTAALTAGTVTVANTSVTANSRIFLTGQVLGGTAGGLNVTSRTAGTSFVVTSTNAADTSTFAYQIFEPG